MKRTGPYMNVLMPLVLLLATVAGVAEGCPSKSPLNGFECMQQVAFLEVHWKWEGEAGRVRVAVDAPVVGFWVAMAFPEQPFRMVPATAAIATSDVAGHYVVSKASGSGVVRDEQAGTDLGLSDTALTVTGNTTRMEFSFSTSILTNGAAHVNFAWHSNLESFVWHGRNGRIPTFIRFDPSSSPAPPTVAPPTSVPIPPTPVPERPPAPPLQDGLWPAGQPVRYYFDTTSSVGGVPPFVDRGIRFGDLFRNETCVTFEQCDDEASCQRPYIAIVNGNSCDAPQGYPGPNSFAQVTTGPECSIEHLVGRVLGLGFEQQRLDRDEFIEVDMAAVAPGQEHRFDVDASEAALGPYAYMSMMHPPAFGYANPGQTTIKSPAEIGFRGLMSTDVWRVNFLYCPRKAPRCVTSREEGVVHKVAVGQAWPVQFTAVSGEEELTVSFEGTTAPEHLLTAVPAAGSSVGTYGRAVTTFTPTEGEVGKRFILSALFSSSSSSASCAVEVEVVAEQCSGCSGHGVCQDSVVQPCVCDEGFAGRDCSGTPSCRDNIAASFDRVLDPWPRQPSARQTTVDNTRAAEGTSGSMRLTKPITGFFGSSGRPSTVLRPGYFLNPPRITFYMASSKVAPEQFPQFVFGFGCIIVELRDTGIMLLSEPLVPREVEAGRFYFFELQQTDGFVRLFVDNQFVAQVEKTCTGNEFVMWGDGWLDEFNVWCTEPVTPAPLTPPPTVPPPTSDNCPPSHPLRKCGRCWVDEAQATSGGCFGEVVCPTSHPLLKCDRCWENGQQAASGGCL